MDHVDSGATYLSSKSVDLCGQLVRLLLGLLEFIAGDGCEVRVPLTQLSDLSKLENKNNNVNINNELLSF